MFEEAASSASSVIQKLCTTTPTNFYSENNEFTLERVIEEFDEMMESAGMVFIQAYNETGRTSEMLGELKSLFGSVTLIPFPVLFTGICLQLSAGLLLTVRETLDEFFHGWTFVEGESWYALSEAESKRFSSSRSWGYYHLPAKKYMEMVELYTVNVLAKGFENPKLALDWLEKTHILEDAKQEIVQKIMLVSQTHEATCATNLGNQLETSQERDALQMSKVSPESEEHSKGIYVEPNSKGDTAISKAFKSFQFPFALLSKLLDFLSSWFPSIAVKLGKLRIVLPQGSTILSWASTFLVLYVLHKKRKFLKRTLMEQSGALRRGLIDLWQLAFSVQLNPLAAVQPLPSAS
eukprot:Gb_01013 [translate_table: standard]